MAPYYDIATRALVVGLKAPCCGKTTAEVAALLGISIRQVNRIYAKAIERGFDPNQRPMVIKDEYLQDAPRSGRPTKQTEETTQQILANVGTDPHGREKTCADIARELSVNGCPISETTVWRILRTAGLQKTNLDLGEEVDYEERR
ncbi:hypothetical protein JDV02_008615 [Purpureocillium takamizusanense]|uniref:Transposase Tc1-like domain-containing protein n=1 Tax=Purpureocillium takamizusanense TaxID=2060973 RepID=A0A9Q8QQ71_9HYPO|nr:uncharacterized protein JDV02_008615 [Purpureocillium takamizusanense]UNI22754.1 hypothetical protein JDV02_008615 [Purpureocillium takamizusanense]